MTQLKTVLSEKEILEYSVEGKGLSAAQCAYYLALCSTRFDSGSCGFIYEQCGVSKPNPKPPCGTCTCR